MHIQSFGYPGKFWVETGASMHTYVHSRILDLGLQQVLCSCLIANMEMRWMSLHLALENKTYFVQHCSQ